MYTQYKDYKKNKTMIATSRVFLVQGCPNKQKRQLENKAMITTSKVFLVQGVLINRELRDNLKIVFYFRLLINDKDFNKIKF